MAWQKSEIDALIVRNVLPQIKSNFADTKPLLALLVGQDVAEMDKLGDPNTGAVFGGRDLMGEATRDVVSGDEEHEVMYQKAQTDAATTIDYRGSVPSASVWAEDSFGTAAFRWSDYWGAIKFGQHSVDSAANSEGHGELRIQSIVEMATQQGFQQLIEKIHNDLVTGSLTSSQQDDRLWNNLIGIQQAVSDGGVTDSQGTHYGRVDRTAETQLQAVVKDASTEASNGNIPDQKVRLDLIRKALLDYGLTKKFAGAGTFSVVPMDMFSTLLEEAEDRNLRVVEGNIPDMGLEGFKSTVIQYGRTMITYDPSIPSGELYVLTPRSWIFEIQRGANFQLDDTIKEKWRLEEGGGYYNYGNLHAKCRLICTEPHLQFKMFNLNA